MEYFYDFFLNMKVLFHRLTISCMIYIIYINFIYMYFFIAISKEDPDRNRTSRDALPSKLQFNGYSEEFLDRIEPNGNIPCSNDEHLSRYGN